MQRIWGPFVFRINFSLSRDLFQPACSFGAQFSLRQPLTSVMNAKNLQTFCLKDIIMNHYAFHYFCILFKFIAPQGFRPEGKIPRRHSGSWNMQSVLDLLEQGPRIANRELVAPASTKWSRWRKDRKSRRDRLGRFCDIYCAVILRYSFALRSDILWSSCFESYGPKDTR